MGKRQPSCAGIEEETSGSPIPLVHSYTVYPAGRRIAAKMPFRHPERRVHLQPWSCSKRRKAALSSDSAGSHGPINSRFHQAPVCLCSAGVVNW
jgi:hypothetical protein